MLWERGWCVGGISTGCPRRRVSHQERTSLPFSPTDPTSRTKRPRCSTVWRAPDTPCRYRSTGCEGGDRVFPGDVYAQLSAGGQGRGSTSPISEHHGIDVPTIDPDDEGSAPLWAPHTRSLSGVDKKGNTDSKEMVERMAKVSNEDRSITDLKAAFLENQ